MADQSENLKNKKKHLKKQKWLEKEPMNVHEDSTVYFVVSSGWGSTTKFLPPPLSSLDGKA